MKELHWISVKDQPIPVDTDVLVYLEKPSLGKRIHSAYFHEKGMNTIGHHFEWDCPKVTHWMLPPEPPKF